jgi:hypothetical protein
MTYSRTLRSCNGCKYGLDCGVSSVRGVDWRFAIGVDVGLNRPVLEVGALPVVFKVRSMVEDSPVVQGHGCREGLSGVVLLRPHGTEQWIRRPSARGHNSWIAQVGDSRNAGWKGRRRWR